MPVEYWEDENQDEGPKSEAELKKEDALLKGAARVKSVPSFSEVPLNFRPEKGGCDFLWRQQS